METGMELSDSVINPVPSTMRGIQQVLSNYLLNNKTNIIWLRLPILEKRKLGSKERKQLIENHRAQAKINTGPWPPVFPRSVLFPVHHVLVYHLVTRGKQTEFPMSCESHSRLIMHKHSWHSCCFLCLFYVKGLEVQPRTKLHVSKPKLLPLLFPTAPVLLIVHLPSPHKQKH